MEDAATSREFLKSIDILEKHQRKVQERRRLQAMIMPRKKGLSEKKEAKGLTGRCDDPSVFASFDDSQFENKQLQEVVDDDIFKPLFAQ